MGEKDVEDKTISCVEDKTQENPLVSVETSSVNLGVNKQYVFSEESSIVEQRESNRIIIDSNIYSDVLTENENTRNLKVTESNFEISDNTEHESVVSSFKTKKKRLTVIDSDSESQEVCVTENITAMFNEAMDSTAEENHKIIIHSNIILEKDLDVIAKSLELDISKNSEGAVTESSKDERNLAILDPDSDDDININFRSENFIYHENTTEHIKNEVLSNLISDENSTKDVEARLKNLCDSDSSSENEHDTEQEIPLKEPLKPTKKSTNQKPKEATNKVPKMTGKQAAKEKQEIYAEAQRRTREAIVSLPYHRPKNRTITEFLKKRPCLSTAIPVAEKIPPSVAIKMSVQELALVSKKLEERKKEVEEFYKSESESEDEDKENVKKGDQNTITANDTKDFKLENNSIEEGVLQNINEVGTTIFSSDNESNILEKERDEKEEANEENDSIINVGNNKTIPEEPDQESMEVETNSRNLALNSAFEQIEQIKNIQASFESENDNKSFKEPQLNHPSENKTASTQDTSNLESFETTNSSSKKNETDKNPELLNALIEKYAPKPNRLALLKEKLSKTKPRLSGNPDDLIDLSDGVVKRNEVVCLMERFMKHVRPLKAPKNDAKVTVVNVSQGEIRREVLTIPAEEEEEAPVVLNEKPGAKLQKLREELQSKILQQRMEQWEKKRSEVQEKDERKGEEEKEGFEEGILDDEEEEEMTEDEEEEEDDLGEDYGKEKARKKSEFLDDEAEVEDDEDEEEDVGDLADDEANEGDSDDGKEEEKEEEEEKKETSKVRRRILNTFDDDSNSCEKTIEKEVNLDSTVSWEDDGPPPHQPQGGTTPAKLATQSKSDLTFLSPIVNLTGLQGTNSASKFLLDSPVELLKSPANAEPSPFREKKWQSQLQKKLFQDNQTQEVLAEHKTDTLPDIDAQITICPENSTVESTQMETQPTTQDLQEICSGNFTEMSQVKATEILRTQEIRLDPVDDSKVKVDEEDEDFISQILNEDEMEKFKEKFRSPAIKNVRDADDSEEEEEILQRNKRRKRLVFSDDEESEIEEEEETIGLCDEDDEKEIYYDSEENEIEIEKTELQRPLNPNEFLEDEAELSESEWGSEDEDEKGLDILETEQGDKEKFDEDQLRTDLERIHMRRVLDEDNREVRMLQELLLEDGELHGMGRQRQFRWRNVNDDNEEEENGNSDEDDVQIEDETEEEWRRRRHEREMFLKKEMEKSQGRDDDVNPLSGGSDSQILKLGEAALRKTQINVNAPESITKQTAKEPFFAAFSSKRGSFLTRADGVLARIAEMTKVSTEVVGGAKSTKNVVFHSVQSASYSEESIFVSRGGKKRKGTEGTPKVIKKLRLQSSVVNI